MSLSQIILLVNWLWAGRWRKFRSDFLGNPIALAVTSLFLIHIAGLVHTSDFPYAFKDLRIKLPILLLPLILSTTDRLDAGAFRNILRLFISSVLFASLVSLAVLFGFTSIEPVDPREISVFISHIRFGLLICMAVFCLVWLSRQEASPRRRMFLWSLVLYLLIFLVILSAITGIVIFIAVTWLLLMRWLWLHPGLRWQKVWLITGFLIPVIPALYIHNIVDEYRNMPVVREQHPEMQTARGNVYTHVRESTQRENDHLVFMYIAWDELPGAWNERSAIPFESVDKKGNEIKNTLIRFLTSKGLRKDADGVAALSHDEINAIEKGIANVRHMGQGNIRGRIESICWEFEQYAATGNPGGHSVTLRLEIWKTAWKLIRAQPLFGVGTGDVDQAFKAQYDADNSPLITKWRLTRSHNQYLSITVALGLAGLAVFLFSLLLPLIRHRHHFLYLAFWLIAAFSMITEDTIENQAGLTFFAFFNAFLLFAAPSQNNNT